MRLISVSIVLVALLGLFLAGCGGLSSMLAEPEWSENYALEAECDVPEMNDGSMYTKGETHPPEYVRGQPVDDSRFSDVIVTFKEPKDIRKIILRRREDYAVAVDVNIMAMSNDKWELVKEMRGVVDNDVNIMVRTVTDKLKIRAQMATRTAKGKSGVAKAQNVTSRTEVSRILREPIKIGEIEIYGLRPKSELETAEK